MTESELNKKIEEDAQKMKAEKLKKELEIFHWREQLGESWKQYIDEKKWDEWEKALKTDDLDNLYMMKEVLDLLIKLENGYGRTEMEWELDHEGQSGYSYEIMKKQLMNFGKEEVFQKNKQISESRGTFGKQNPRLNKNV